jgi:hypothetical protein
VGLDQLVPDAIPLDEALARLGASVTIMMIDGALVMPTTSPPPTWREVRLRTPAGTVTLARRGTGVAVVVFGNADEALRGMQSRIAAALAPA